MRYLYILILIDLFSNITRMTRFNTICNSWKSMYPYAVIVQRQNARSGAIFEFGTGRSAFKYSCPQQLLMTPLRYPLMKSQR